MTDRFELQDVMQANRDRDINRQIEDFGIRRQSLLEELMEMKPSRWRQDRSMNEVAVWTKKQRERREAIGRELERLDAADKALYSIR
jgi:hypothetical protein